MPRATARTSRHAHASVPSGRAIGSGEIGSTSAGYSKKLYLLVVHSRVASEALHTGSFRGSQHLYRQFGH